MLVAALRRSFFRLLLQVGNGPPPRKPTSGCVRHSRRCGRRRPVSNRNVTYALQYIMYACMYMFTHVCRQCACGMHTYFCPYTCMHVSLLVWLFVCVDMQKHRLADMCAGVILQIHGA